MVVLEFLTIHRTVKSESVIVYELRIVLLANAVISLLRPPKSADSACAEGVAAALQVMCFQVRSLPFSFAPLRTFTNSRTLEHWQRSKPA
jgi:hypothetical protein